MRKTILAAVAAAALAAPAAAQEVTLRAASFVPVGQSFAKYFQRWFEEVNKRGAGIVKIVAVGPEAIPTPEQPNAVKTGVVQMHYGPPTFYAGQMIEGESLSLAERTIKELRANGAWAYLDKLHRERMNVHLLGGLGDGLNFYVYTTEPIKKPVGSRDKPFDGMTLRSVPLYKAFFESLGARTVSLPPGEVYTALERKVVQGYGWPRWTVKDMGWLPVTKYRYGPGFFNVNVNVLVNLDAWNKLNDKQRAFLTEMGLWLDEIWPVWKKAEDEAEDKIQVDAGVKFVDMGAWFNKQAHDAYWTDLEKKSPVHIPHLKKLVTK